MEQIIHWDHVLFEWINFRGSNSVFDAILPILRNKYFWLPTYIFIISFVIYNYGRKAYYFLIFLIGSVSLADFTSAKFFKPYFARLRPCKDDGVEFINMLVECGSGYSFTSNHAANHFAISIFLYFTLGNQFKQIRPFLILWAFLVAYAQIYVGVHFPFDVLCGGLLGGIIGYGMSYIYRHSNREIVEFR